MQHIRRKLSSANNLTRLYPSYNHRVSSYWNTPATNTISSNDLIYPLFLSDSVDSVQPIASLPGQYRIGTDKLAQFLEPLVKNGLKSVLLFGCVENRLKNNEGSCADSENNPVVQGIMQIKKYFPELYTISDICLCAYTTDGSCGIVDSTRNNAINVQKSIQRLAQISSVYAQAGCDCVAPSDMLDNRVAMINQSLIDSDVRDDVAIMSYSAKFSSYFYGPFRDACQSNYTFGKKRPHQLPIASKSLALKAINRDITEGTDFVIVKPGSLYLDVISSARAEAAKYTPVIAYQVSGEYAMLYYASKHGALNLECAIYESLMCFKRAGSSAIISYFTPQILEWIKEGKLI